MPVYKLQRLRERKHWIGWIVGFLRFCFVELRNRSKHRRIGQSCSGVDSSPRLSACLFAAASPATPLPSKSTHRQTDTGCLDRSLRQRVEHRVQGCPAPRKEPRSGIPECLHTIRFRLRASGLKRPPVACIALSTRSVSLASGSIDCMDSPFKQILTSSHGS